MLARGRSGSRRAARATARASIESDLPTVRAVFRAWAVSRVPTRSTTSSAPRRKRSRRPLTWRQSSRAKRTSPPSPAISCAQERSSRWPFSVPGTVSSPSSCPVESSTAAAVWVSLWGVDADRDHFWLVSWPCRVVGRIGGGQNRMGLKQAPIRSRRRSSKRGGRQDPPGQPPRRRDNAESARRAEDARPGVGRQLRGFVEA